MCLRQMTSAESGTQNLGWNCRRWKQIRHLPKPTHLKSNVWFPRLKRLADQSFFNNGSKDDMATTLMSLSAAVGEGELMPVSIVVGGQFGSEGKGQVSLELVRPATERRIAVVRVSGRIRDIPHMTVQVRNLL